jgi:hypothetical protein
MMGQIESLLEKGIEAARDNEKKRAQDILTHVIELDQYNEKAWLWLSSVVSMPADKAVCLENAAYSDEIVHVFRSCCPLSERSDASINIIPSSGRHGQGRIGLSARLPLQIEPVGIVN